MNATKIAENTLLVRFRWGFIVVLILVLMTGCTGRQIEPIPTATALPDPSGSNPHANLEPFSAVNKNPDLTGRPVTVTIGHVQTRTLAVPPLWSYTGNNPIWPNVPPYLYLREDLGGYQFEPFYISGTFGLRQDGIELFTDQRYIVKITYSSDLDPIDPATFTGIGDFSVCGNVYNTSGGTSAALVCQTIPALKQRRIEQIWVIESDKPYPTVTFEVYFSFKWASLQGGLIVHRIEIQTAPEDFGDDNPRSILHF